MEVNSSSILTTYATSHKLSTCLSLCHSHHLSFSKKAINYNHHSLRFASPIPLVSRLSYSLKSAAIVGKNLESLS
uniref:Uncharacterized protein n=1 Tax=Salix viminalis TaxID=40686 RepID=A0A6N2NKQ1_SALVM